MVMLQVEQREAKIAEFDHLQLLKILPNITHWSLFDVNTLSEYTVNKILLVYHDIRVLFKLDSNL